jgi:hypothetical protein
LINPEQHHSQQKNRRKDKQKPRLLLLTSPEAAMGAGVSLLFIPFVAKAALPSTHGDFLAFSSMPPIVHGSTVKPAASPAPVIYHG